MSSRASVESLHVEHRTKSWPRRGRHCGSSHFFGLDAEEMGPKGQIFGALAVLAPVALSGVLLIAFVPGLWWIFTTYFWVAFPAFGLLVRGIASLSEGQAKTASARSTGERELLEALLREGEVTPVRAAMETPLSVAEADAMLKELAKAGHLEVRVRGGGLFYALWEQTGRFAPEIRSAQSRESKTTSQEVSTWPR